MGTTFGYARTIDDAYIGYRIDGEGPVDIVHQPDWPGNIDFEWDEEWSATWFAGLGSMGRLIMHDHRGVGLSSRNVSLPTLEVRVSDLFGVLDGVGVQAPVMVGSLSTGAVNALACASRPGYARALVWLDPAPRYASAPDYPWGRTATDLAEELEKIATWGTESYATWFWQDQAETGFSFDAADAVAWLAKTSRNACTPDVARDLARIWFDTDVRGALPSVRTPTLLVAHDEKDSLGQARMVADLIGSAELVVLPRSTWTIDDQAPVLDAIRGFIGAERPRIELDAILRTVLFTDIVDSTARQASVGDHAWKELIGKHHGIVRDCLARWRGSENDTAGDGFYATFEGPARAIRCAQEITDRVRRLGIQIRAGVHTGECELIDGKVGGLAVSIGARVASLAAPSEVLVSQTVKDLVAGSGLSFDDAGAHELKGVPDRWQLYRVVPGDRPVRP
jgi:class 3 adenylate cyclase